MKYFFIASIGCFGRHLDCERIKNYFIANSIALTDSPAHADYLFISTCGLTRLHEDLSIDDILRFKRFRGKTFVGGCLPEMNAKRITDVFNGEVISTKNLDRIDEFFPDFTVKFKDVPDGNSISLADKRKKINYAARAIKEIDLYWLYKSLRVVGEIREKITANDAKALKSIFKAIPRMPLIDLNNNFFSIRVSSGCLGACSYCNIKKAIGGLRSKPISLLLEELKKALRDKRFRLNIISSDTGAYGLDINSSFPQLMEAILGQDRRISIEYLGNMNPSWLCLYKNEILKLFESRRIKSMSSAIQSGNVRILKLMRRDGNLDEFKNLIKGLKKVHPSLRIRTQVIAGFPTETEQEFQDTINLIKECSFNEVDVFYYHETDLMDSVKILPKVSHDDIVSRMQKLRRQLSVDVTINFYNLQCP